MAKAQKKRIKNKGVTITVIPRKKRYNLYIEVSPEADISEPIKGDGYNFKLTFYDGRKVPGVPMSFERLSKPHKYAKGGLKLTTSDYIIKNSEYKLVLYLEPNFYASNAFIGDMERRRKKAKHKANKKKQEGSISFGRGGFAKPYRSTPYSYNNVFKPYGGGGWNPR